jgi:hypothetical protein
VAQPAWMGGKVGAYARMVSAARKPTLTTERDSLCEVAHTAWAGLR